MEREREKERERETERKRERDREGERENSLQCILKKSLEYFLTFRSAKDIGFALN